ncbi:MAG TPA: glycosyltransferase family 4 protein [Burkholderiales bacterium]|jgi:glycosyltransferase involved in cell wall biosynthesis
MKQPVVLLLGPDRGAISGVSTHLNLLFGSALARRFDLAQFQVGSEGRTEGRIGLLARMAASPFLLAAAILRTRAAIVHVNTSLNTRSYWRDLAYVAAAKLCGARVVYQIHGGTLQDFYKPVLRATLRWPDVIVVLSRCELEETRAIVPEQSVALVPNAIDCTPFQRHRRPAPDPRAPLGLIHIGRLVKEKGVFEMVEGLALARRQGVAASLVIAGDGPALSGLQERVERLGLAERVSFAGPAFGERKARLLGEADVLLFPTYHREGLPYVLLEGMAAGLAPITTRVAAIPDVITEGLHGLFVPPRDPEAVARAIAALAADRTRLARMSAACRERVAASYSIERLADDFTMLYHKLERKSWAPSQAG